MAPKFATATASSAIASGQIDCLSVTITLSMMSRWISGMAAVKTVASTAPATAKMKLRRYSQQ